MLIIWEVFTQLKFSWSKIADDLPGTLLNHFGENGKTPAAEMVVSDAVQENSSPNQTNNVINIATP